MQDLINQKCQPCEGGVPPFSEAKAQEYLTQVQGWRADKEFKKIEGNFKFNNFKEALDFVNKVGQLAEKEGHHPDILLHSYNQLKVILVTHAIGGLSNNDFIMAAKIDNMLN